MRIFFISGENKLLILDFWTVVQLYKPFKLINFDFRLLQQNLIWLNY